MNGPPLTFAAPLRDEQEAALRDHLRRVDTILRGTYGTRDWESHGDPLDQLIATILSQHTSDANTARAFGSLKQRFPAWEAVIDAETESVAEAIRQGGLAGIKAPRIQQTLRIVVSEFGSPSLDALRSMSTEDARRWLLRIPGVGPKTAACVLLFSLGRPVFPVDTHVFRVSRRLGLVDSTLNAAAAHEALEWLIGPDRDTMYALHLNLIDHGRAICKARVPRCGLCALRGICPSASQ